MKKITIKLTVVAIVVALALTLISCSGGGLSGTYNAAGGSMSGVYFNNEPLVSVEFKPFDGAEITTGGWSTTTYEDGGYKLNGSQLTLKAEWNYTDKWEGTYEFRQSGNSIYIDGHEYVK